VRRIVATLAAGMNAGAGRAPGALMPLTETGRHARHVRYPVPMRAVRLLLT
jgi:hypothetical protein